MTTDTSTGRRRPLVDFLVGPDQFGVLLVLLILAFLLPEGRGRGWPLSVVSIVNIAAFAAGISASGLSSRRRTTAVVVVAGLAGVVLLVSAQQESLAAGAGALLMAIAQLVVLGAVVGRVLAHERVNSQTLLGALAAYFLIGLFFAWIYLAIEGFVDGPVLQPETEGIPSYYSFVVLTTLGFGDISPVDEFARKVTAIQAITGQIFLATLVARLVSMYGRPRGPG